MWQRWRAAWLLSLPDRWEVHMLDLATTNEAWLTSGWWFQQVFLLVCLLMSKRDTSDRSAWIRNALSSLPWRDYHRQDLKEYVNSYVWCGVCFTYQDKLEKVQYIILLFLNMLLWFQMYNAQCDVLSEPPIVRPSHVAWQFTRWENVRKSFIYSLNYFSSVIPPSLLQWMSECSCSFRLCPSFFCVF